MFEAGPRGRSILHRGIASVGITPSRILASARRGGQTLANVFIVSILRTSAPDILWRSQKRRSRNSSEVSIPSNLKSTRSVPMPSEGIVDVDLDRVEVSFSFVNAVARSYLETSSITRSLMMP